MSNSTAFSVETYRTEVHQLPSFFRYKIKPPIVVASLVQMSGMVAMQPVDTERFLLTSAAAANGAAPDVARSFWASATRIEVRHATKGLCSRLVGNLPPIIPYLYESVTVYLDRNSVLNAHQTERQMERAAPAVFGRAVAYQLQHRARETPTSISFYEFKLLFQQLFRTVDMYSLDVPAGLMSDLYNAVIEPCTHLPPSAKQRMSIELCDVALQYESSPLVRNATIPCASIEEYLDSKGVLGTNVRRSMHYKMFFRTKQWCALARYYHEDLIGAGISLDAFDQLYNALCTAPIALCFSPNIPVRAAVSVRVSNIAPSKSSSPAPSSAPVSIVVEQSLPELTAMHLFDAMQYTAADSPTAATRTPTTTQIIAVCAYWAMHEFMGRTKSTYATVMELFHQTVSVMCTIPAIQTFYEPLIAQSWTGPMWRDACKLLTTFRVIDTANDGALNVSTTLVCLREHKIWEHVIASSVHELVQRHRSVRPFELPAGTTFDTLTTAAGHALCDEQQVALRSVMDNAVTVISGPAGSGKSDLLRALTSLLASSTSNETAATIGNKELAPPMIATSIQNNNAADLAGVFGNMACFTSHSLLLMHQRLCASTAALANASAVVPGVSNEFAESTSSSSSSRAGASKCRCMLQNVRVLVIEEASLYTPELAARVIGTLVLCAPNFSRLIILGDRNQLPSVDCGNFLVDFCRAVETANKPWARVVMFTHNHRVHPSSIVLKHNADYILQRQPHQLQFGGDASVFIALENSMRKDFVPPELVAEMEQIATKVLTSYELTVFNSHFITRTNKSRTILENILRTHYYRRKFPTADTSTVNRNARSHDSAFRGCKILFDSMPRDNDRDFTVIPNRIYIVISVIDVDHHTIKTNERAHRNVTEVNSTLDERSGRDATRFLLLYEMSTVSERRFEFSSFRRTMPTLTQTIECEAKRLIAEIRQANNTNNNSSNINLPGGVGRNVYDETRKTINDPRSFFTVVPWCRAVQDVMSSACTTTVNKFQGLQVKTVVFWIVNKSPYDTCENVYTAVTRGQERVVIVANRQNLDTAIVRREPKRTTQLPDQMLSALDVAQPIHYVPIETDTTEPAAIQQQQQQANESSSNKRRSGDNDDDDKEHDTTMAQHERFKTIARASKKQRVVNDPGDAMWLDIAFT
jgi:energy-coupling factor transporter ATP-binding protein EcfA2